MNETSLNTCTEVCNECKIQSKTNCHFSLNQLLKFYLIVLPSFILGGIGISDYGNISLMIWLIIIVAFFLILEIRVLCSHCPHYLEPTNSLRCWANYGAPKLWKYRPGPLNIFEKTILLSGFLVVWGYPVVFISLLNNWLYLFWYIISVVFFYIFLKLSNCRRCINFACPLNGVKAEVKEQFFRNNPTVYNSWKKSN